MSRKKLFSVIGIILVISFFISIFYGIFTEDESKYTITENITVDEAFKLINEGDVFILDVRSESEYREGHVPGAENIPYDQLEERIDELNISKEDDIIVYCRTGRRSSIAVEILEKHGYKNIKHMNQGISQWKCEVEV